MVSVLTFYSDKPTSNTPEVYNFSEQIFIEMTENKQKRQGFAHFLNVLMFVKLLKNLRRRGGGTYSGNTFTRCMMKLNVGLQV